MMAAHSIIDDRIRLLSNAFTIDIAAYAIMSNHYHLVLHVNQAKAEKLSDYDIAKRWVTVFKGSKVVERYLAGDDSLAELANATLSKWRERLYNLSWFMRCLNDHITRSICSENLPHVPGLHNLAH